MYALCLTQAIGKVTANHLKWNDESSLVYAPTIRKIILQNLYYQRLPKPVNNIMVLIVQRFIKY
jgi:hypothetical protein